MPQFTNNQKLRVSFTLASVCITFMILWTIPYHKICNIHTPASNSVRVDNDVFSNDCFEVNVNVEKSPKLFYRIVHNQTLFNSFGETTLRLMFYLRINYSLPTQVKLVAFSDTIMDLVNIMHLDYGRNAYAKAKLRIVYNAETKEVLFNKCFDGAVLVNQMLQMGVYEFLQGAYITLFLSFSK